MIVLPKPSRATDYKIVPVREGEVLRAATGGALLPPSALGDHWAMEIEPEALDLTSARALVFDILSGAGERVRVPIPEPGVDKGAPGNAVEVDGDGVAGTSLPLRGLTVRFVVRKGWYITVESEAGSRAYLTGSEVIVDEDGKATVSVWPMVSIEPADGDRVEIIDPYIEGPMVEGGEHSTGLLPIGEPGSFVVEEG